MTKLTGAQVEKLAEPGRYSDGNGLYLRIANGGSRNWVCRVYADGRRQDLGLGSYPAVGLREARKAAEAARVAVAGGGSVKRRQDAHTPRPAPKQVEAVLTFREAAIRCHQWIASRWTSDKHRNSWLPMLERHAFPTLGAIPIDAITRKDVVSTIKLIWGKDSSMGRKVRQRITTVLELAVELGEIPNNPAAGMKVGKAGVALEKLPSHVNGNFASLPWGEVPDAYRTIMADTGSSEHVRLCMAFTVLTASRSNETRNALWEEISLEEGLWTVPASKMKSGRPQRVPLSRQAVAILKQAQGENPRGRVFKSTRGRMPISLSALENMVKRLGLACTPHGFRASARTWFEDATTAEWSVKEMVLGHSIGSETVKAYQRSDLLAKRAELLQAWADWVSPD